MWNDLEKGWQPAVEILILGVLIYFAFRFVRGTRGWPVVIGFVVVLLALKAVTTILDLKVLSWLLDSASLFIAVGALVIFQPELRRALASMGRRGSLLRAFWRYQEAHMIDEVVRAITALAAKKVGAILVVERDSRLSDIVDSGTPMDAVVSRRLLESIFYPYSPLHDGAVILSRDRIMAAACLLPLSINPDLPRDLGTRHRAAVGVSEESDAIAIVVSEETGNISLVIGGEISSNLDGPALRQRLSHLLYVTFLAPGSASQA